MSTENNRVDTLVKHISRVFHVVEEDLEEDLRNRRPAHLLFMTVNRQYRKFTHSQQPIRRLLKGQFRKNKQLQIFNVLNLFYYQEINQIGITSFIAFSLSCGFENKQLLLLALLWLVSKETAVWRRWESETPKFGIKRVDDRGSNCHREELKETHVSRVSVSPSSERILKLT